MLEDLSFPPLNPDPDEKKVGDGPDFAACNRFLNALAMLGNTDIVDRTYSVSTKWGQILRAKIILSHDPRVSPEPIIFWGSKTSAHVLLDMCHGE